eukprot:6200147-Pleurochrysis_carterae.AAC.1
MSSAEVAVSVGIRLSSLLSDALGGFAGEAVCSTRFLLSTYAIFFASAFPTPFLFSLSIFPPPLPSIRNLCPKSSSHVPNLIRFVTTTARSCN